jgi:HD-GYP domain-containing protein (c-di-GMP phosphodiesterase class II)
VKRWYQQFGVSALFLLSIVLITMVLRFSQQQNPILLSSLHNIYYVPILVAAVFFGDAMCVTIALCAAVGSCIADYGCQWPTSAAWWSVGIRGAFFLTLGYLSSHISSRIQSNSRGWQSLLEISRAINSSLDLDEVLQVITKQSVELTSADACAIRLLSDDGEELLYAKSWGLSDRYMTKGPLRISESAFVRRALETGEIVTRDVRKTDDLQYREETLAEGIVIIMSVPLRTGDRVIGLLNLYRKRFAGFAPRDRRVARAFAEQAAIAIQNARLYASIRKNYLDTVRALSRAIEANDPMTLGHSERVAAHAVSMARALGLSAQDVQTIEFGSLLHDLGKISLDEQTLIKTGALSVDERVMLEMHPMIGKSILEPVEFLRPAIPILMYHHERWDGQGYPERLAGEQIPLLARIVAVANGLDHQMNHVSPFPMTMAAALEVMRQEAGSKYDPALVTVLASAIEQHAAVQLAVHEEVLDPALQIAELGRKEG